MSHELICSWLGLSPDEWPPNHYRLLGLTPGETDSRLIEQQVHQRLDALRRYQMTNPEQATEALNRLAQAFVCLTEPISKRRYDQDVIGLRPHEDSEAPTALDLPSIATVVFPSPPATQPPPLPTPVAPSPLPPRIVLTPPAPLTVSDPTPVPSRGPLRRPQPPSKPPAERIDPAVEAARSPRARRGIGSRRLLYGRVKRLRRLTEVWQQAGRYLNTIKRPALSEPEKAELGDLLGRIARYCRRFPRILGVAGQPGYHVLLLTKHDPVASFLELRNSERDALRRDWQAGLKLFHAHRDFLREQATELRLMTRAQRFQRALKRELTDQPGTILLLSLLLALNLLLWFPALLPLWKK